MASLGFLAANPSPLDRDDDDFFQRYAPPPEPGPGVNNQPLPSLRVLSNDPNSQPAPSLAQSVIAQTTREHYAPHQDNFWRPGMVVNPLVFNAQTMRMIIHASVTEYLNTQDFFFSFAHGREGRTRAYKILHLLASRDILDIPFLTWILSWAIIHTKGQTLVEIYLHKIKENYQEEFAGYYQKFSEYQAELRPKKACKEVIKKNLNEISKTIKTAKNPVIMQLIAYLNSGEEKFTVDYLCSSSKFSP